MLSILVLAIAVMIFLFSAQPAIESAKTSNSFTDFVIRLFYPGFPNMTASQKRQLYTELAYLVRKMAHFSEFALLGAALRLLFHALRIKWPLFWAWLAGTLYAVSDEVHQMFVDSRGPAVTDVLIDSAGVLTLACLMSLLLMIRKRIKRKTDPDYQ